MAINVGDAVLKLGVDTKDLDKGLKGLTNKIKQHQKAIGIGMVAAGGAILAAGVMSVKTYAAMGDEVAKMAKRTGFSTEALSELRHAAEISGASLDSLEKAVKRMSTSILDAKDGLLETQRSLDRLGISVEDLEGLSPEEQFFKIANALAEVEDASDRAALAQKLFGRAGTQLLPLLAEGADGIAKLRQEAHDLGIVFDLEAAQAAEEMTDAMDRLGKSTTGIKMIIATQLIPILIPLVDKITKIVKEIIAWVKEHPRLTQVIVLGNIALAGFLTTVGLLLIFLPGLASALVILKGTFIANTFAVVAHKIALWAHVIATGAATIATGILTLSVLALTLALSALLLGLGMVAFGITMLILQRNAEKKATEEQIRLEEEYTKALAGEANQYKELLLIRIQDIEMRKLTGKATAEEIEWLEKHGDAMKEWAQDTEGSLSSVQTASESLKVGMQSLGDVIITEAQRASKGWSDAAEEIIGSWNAMRRVAQRGRGGAGISTREMVLAEAEKVLEWYRGEEAYPGEFAKAAGIITRAMETVYGTPEEAPEVYGEYGHGGIITRPTLARLGEAGAEAVIPLTGRKPMINNIIHVFLGGREVTDLVVEHIDEEIRLQGGF